MERERERKWKKKEKERGIYSAPWVVLKFTWKIKVFNVKCRRKFSKDREKKIEREKEKEKEKRIKREVCIVLHEECEDYMKNGSFQC